MWVTTTQYLGLRLLPVRFIKWKLDQTQVETETNTQIVDVSVVSCSLTCCTKNNGSCLPYLTQSAVLTAHPSLRTCHNCQLFNGWVSFHWMYIAHFIYWHICWWRLGLLLPFDVVNQAAMNTVVQTTFWALSVLSGISSNW